MKKRNRITKVVTRGGDGGETSLADGSRVRKNSPRVEAFGDVDEVNAVIGLILSTERLDEEIAEILVMIQEDLFVLGADLSSPKATLTVSDAMVATLDDLCIRLNAELPPLGEFILPGGTSLSARLHHLRTVVRRAERHIVQLAETETVNPPVVPYLNRLSDLAFILARKANRDADVQEAQIDFDRLRER